MDELELILPPHEVNITEPALIRNKPVSKQAYYINNKRVKAIKITNDLSKKAYYNEVWRLTEENAPYVDNIEARGKFYHLDHIMPIAYGFRHNLPPEHIGRLSNLRIITWHDNFAKGAKYRAVERKWDYLR